MRMVLLRPSATEITWALGLEDQLVGVTHECDCPPSVKPLPKVTRTPIPAGASSAEIDHVVREGLQTGSALYTLHLLVPVALRSELVVTQALWEVCAVAEVRATACVLSRHPRAIYLEPQTLVGVLASIRLGATAVGVDGFAEEVVKELTARVAAVVARTARVLHRPRVALLEWLAPPFYGEQWSPELVRMAGGINGLDHKGRPWRTRRGEEVLAWQPEVVFVACCGFGIEPTLCALAALQFVSGWQDVPAVRWGRV